MAPVRIISGVLDMSSATSEISGEPTAVPRAMTGFLSHLIVSPERGSLSGAFRQLLKRRSRFVAGPLGEPSRPTQCGQSRKLLDFRLHPIHRVRPHRLI